ncbi:MAG: hypothetical protein ABI763_14530 [Bacteroidota bacterium]
MKTLTSLFLLAFIVAGAFAQPCKQVKQGMTKAEVLILVGTPTEIDTLSTLYRTGEQQALYTVVWQYGDVSKDGNQRVQFTGDKVDGDVIADGKKYDELMLALRRRGASGAEIEEMGKKLNREECK